ncbi:PaaI family thioesterase [Sneathiella sp.]|uniref:PaaI family thioesterase n=1 Tax=Sneathiella sp. TaxID=1964365 RepID=UPI002FE399B0
MTKDIPEGFTEFAGAMGFVELSGPLLVKYAEDGARLGLRVTEKHCNPANICHGGMLMTFADMQLGVGARSATGAQNFLPTVHMSCDFVAPVPNGAWLEGETRVIRQTRSMIFATCTLTADGEMAFSASGIMKISARNKTFAKVSLPPLK